MSDYIKREDALDAWYDKERFTDIEAIPSADVVERKRGKWIVMNDDYIDDCKCSECGCIEYFNKGWKRFNFCPNCGADMRGES